MAPAWTAVAVAAAAVAASSDGGERPHIVLAVVDDLGWSDVGFQGSKDLGGSTPHLDALAAEGLRFESLYGAAECTPSRAMLLTGTHAVRLGLQDSVIHGTEPRGLDLRAATLADALRSDHGYATHAVGKWHLGFFAPAYLPRRRGFDTFYGILTGGGDHFAHTTTESFAVRGNRSTASHSVTGRNLWEDDGPLDDAAFAAADEAHTTRLYTARALRKIQTFGETEGKRSFLYLAYQAVHGPVQAESASYAAGTACAGVADRADAARSALAAGARDPDLAYASDGDVSWKARPRLCGMVAEIDGSVGQIRAALGGRWASTILWVLSDNGGVKRHGSSNYPLRGQKGEYWEGGVRLASVVAGGYLADRGLGAGATSGALAHLVDVHASLTAAARGSPLVEDVGADWLAGANLWPTLLTETAAPPRSALLLNRNSRTWGGGGALVADSAAVVACDAEDDAPAVCGRRYKLVVENSVGDAVLYRAGRAYLAADDYGAAGFAAALDGRRSELFPSPLVHLFDLDADPSEASDLANATASDPALAAVLDGLLALWADVDDVAAVDDVWRDDGPLASPDFFDGAWMPWRDENDAPYAQYGLLPARR